MSPQRKKNRIVAVMNTPCKEVEGLVDYTVEMNIGQNLENVLLGFNYVTFAQTVAVLKSCLLYTSIRRTQIWEKFFTREQESPQSR